jgi:hypothetical protein
MPRIRMFFDITDYFEKYGFDDGNYSSLGYNAMSQTLKILNKHLQPFKIKASQLNESGCHNNCRIDLTLKNGTSLGGENVYCWSRQDWIVTLRGSRYKDPDSTADKVIEALSEADAELDRTLDEESLVDQTPDSELALLINSLEDPIARQKHEARLKSIQIEVIREMAKQAISTQDFIARLKVVVGE